MLFQLWSLCFSWTRACCQTVCLNSPGWHASSPTSPPWCSTCTSHLPACVKHGRTSWCRWIFVSPSLFRLLVCFLKAIFQVEKHKQILRSTTETIQMTVCASIKTINILSTYMFCPCCDNFISNIYILKHLQTIPWERYTQNSFSYLWVLISSVKRLRHQHL